MLFSKPKNLKVLLIFLLHNFSGQHIKIQSTGILVLQSVKYKRMKIVLSTKQYNVSLLFFFFVAIHIIITGPNILF